MRNSAEFLAGHKLLMQRIEDEGDEKASWRSNALASLTGSLDNEELGRMAERLLANRAVNQPLVPDFVERQLYINCLKLLFRLLDALTTTLRITVCGHDLKLVFEPVRKDDERRSSLGSDLRERVKKVSLSLTPVNLAAVAACTRSSSAPSTTCSRTQCSPSSRTESDSTLSAEPAACRPWPRSRTTLLRAARRRHPPCGRARRARPRPLAAARGPRHTTPTSAQGARACLWRPRQPPQASRSWSASGLALR